MDITQRPLVSDEEIKNLLNAAVNKLKNEPFSHQFSASGEHVSDAYGQGLDFAEHRLYQRGDDTRHIDWRASARSNDLLHKRFYAEISAPSCIVIDRRESMLFGSETRLKATQAIRAGIYLGAQLIHAKQHVACLVIDDHLYWQTPSNSLAEFNKTAHYAARSCPPKNQINPKPLHWPVIAQTINAQLTRGSRLVLISDFFKHESSKKPDDKALKFLSQNYNLSCVCISDIAEHQLNQKSLSLNYHHRVHHLDETDEFNQHLKQYQTQLKAYLKKLNCKIEFVLSDDDISTMNIF